MSLYTVTYLNEDLGQRCPLVENIPLTDVLPVMERFGNPRDPDHWLPELAFNKVEDYERAMQFADDELRRACFPSGRRNSQGVLVTHRMQPDADGRWVRVSVPAIQEAQ